MHDAIRHRPLPVTQATLVNGVGAANSVAAIFAAAACVAVVAGAVAEAAATVDARLARASMARAAVVASVEGGDVVALRSVCDTSGASGSA